MLHYAEQKTDHFCNPTGQFWLNTGAREELRKQREAFKTFAENKRNAVLVDATQDAKQVADSITEKVLRYKAEQTAKLMHCTLDDEGVPV